MARLPDALASRLIARMVVEYEDDEDESRDDPSLDDAFATALDECHEDVPDGFGSQRVIEDLTDRGWLRIRRTVVREAGNQEALEGPIEIVEITAAGFSHARGSGSGEGTSDGA